MNRELLFDTFPELHRSEVDLQKEVLAHFGLTFSSFALLEASLQNLYVVWRLDTGLKATRTRDQELWQKTALEFEAEAMNATLGSLIRMLIRCDPVVSHLEELRALKGRRDYFAHHFFREELRNMVSDDRRLSLINAMFQLRGEIEPLMSAIDVVTHSFLHHWHGDSLPMLFLAEEAALRDERTADQTDREYWTTRYGRSRSDKTA